ncbi:MAG: NAD(P)-dependent oxidoreductase, partial [Pseudomonadota bacterium]
KARLALKTEAELRLIAPEFCPELADLLASGQAREFYAADAALFEDATLVFVATGCKGSDAAWHARAKTAGALVSVVDYPGLCDAMTPAIVDRDPVVVAIGTEGTAPLLGRQIKTPLDIERDLGMVGGDIFHGALHLDQLYSLRPVAGYAAYRMPVTHLYLCGSGAHPGGGVTGLPGHHAARQILVDRKRWA